MVKEMLMAYKKHLREQKIKKKVENDNYLNINKSYYLDMEEESYLILAGMSQEFNSKSM